jgi:hypothetical protein
MAILLVHHDITDLETWLDTYAKYAEAREQGGVRDAHIYQPHDNPKSIVVIHYFDTTEAAENFRTFLREQVWTGAARGMNSEPHAMILREVDIGPKT